MMVMMVMTDDGDHLGGEAAKDSSLAHHLFNKLLIAWIKFACTSFRSSLQFLPRPFWKETKMVSYNVKIYNGFLVGNIFMDDNKFVLMVMMLSTGMIKVKVICDLFQPRQNVRHLVEHVACALDCCSSVRCLALKNNL